MNIAWKAEREKGKAIYVEVENSANEWNFHRAHCHEYVAHERIRI